MEHGSGKSKKTYMYEILKRKNSQYTEPGKPVSTHTEYRMCLRFSLNYSVKNSSKAHNVW